MRKTNKIFLFHLRSYNDTDHITPVIDYFIKKKESVLLKREKRLAYSLLFPTIIMVLSIVLIPLFANFWISFKPISLSDLRPPKLILKEKVRGKLTENKNTSEIHYRYRNSSPKYSLNSDSSIVLNSV